MRCSKCGKEEEHGGMFPSVNGEEEFFECVKCHPRTLRYLEGKGKMADYLPGGKKWTGALLRGDAPGDQSATQ